MSLQVQVKKDFGGFVLDVSFVSQRSRIGILGASGCGKSMTLKSIAGIVRPDSGRIVLNDRVLFDSEAHVNLPPQKRKVGYLFQNYALFPNMTVVQNIQAGLRDLSKEERQKRTQEMLETFALKGLERHFPDQLSGGQQQRVALARIMAYAPDVILLDEPFSALDAYLRDRLQEEMMEILSTYDGVVVMVSHNRDELYRFSEDLLVMNNGRVDMEGDAQEVFAAPTTKEAAILTGCKNFSDVEKVDAHTFKALSWGITIHTQEALPEDFDCIGYRAHEFVPVYGERQENCLRVNIAGMAELPFEKNYYIKPENREHWEREDVISWFVQQNLWPMLQEKGLPTYLQLEEKSILFLKSEKGEKSSND
jgi:molybdate transport system ATP-binding protein